jgi:transposase
MNIITQEARKRQSVVKIANRKGKSLASRIYGVSLSSVKRWCKRYDGTWKSLAERSHRPHSHPCRQTQAEEMIIRAAFKEKYFRYGWDGVFDEAIKKGYRRSLSGMR